jgi:protein-S-isoprenylcysteine O-methyltransferase Ste14
MTLGHLIFALATTGYMAIGILFEERDLIALYGEPYAEYRRHVWAVRLAASTSRSPSAS